jgi:hypothetical protein
VPIERVISARMDFTTSEFDSPISYDDIPSSREEALSDCSERQYELLRGRVVGLGSSETGA